MFEGKTLCYRKPGARWLELSLDPRVVVHYKLILPKGYIVVVPAAPDGELFFEEGARVFPEFSTKLMTDFKVDGGKFHIACISNGGLSAFYSASLYPQFFLSVTGFSGLLNGATTAKLKALSACASTCTWEN